MGSLLSRGVRVTKEEGVVSFLSKTTAYLRAKRRSYTQSIDRFVKQNYLLGIVLTPIYCLLNGHLVIRRRNYYVKYTLGKNIFGRRRMYVVDLETIGKGSGLERRYFRHEQCPVEPSDSLLDIGAARGMSTQIAARKAKHVFAFEPSPRMFNCLRKNVNGDNIEIFQRAGWNEPGEMEMNYGDFAKDDSLLTPDTGDTGISQTVRVETIERFAAEHGLDTIDFVKIEAEGAEPEVIDGIEDVDIQKIVVNCSPERDDHSPAGEVMEKLRAMGYEVDSPEGSYEVFAWKPDTE